MGLLHRKNDAALQTNVRLLPMKLIRNNTMHGDVYGYMLSEQKHF